MHPYRLQSSSAQFHQDPKIGRLVLVSLVLHLVFVLVMSGALYLSPRREPQPVYYVDLIHKPVLNPQAGRPDPRPKAKPAPEKAVAAPPPPKPVEPPPKPAEQPKPKPKPAEPPQPKPAPPPPKAVEPAKPVAKPIPKPEAKAEPRPDPKAAQGLQSALDKMRERQARQAEIEALKQKVASLQDARPTDLPEDVPVGMPTGSGDEIGVSTLAYIEAFIRQNWNLSPYLLDQSRLASIEAKVKLQYSAEGKLMRFRVIESSGNSQFDESIKNAITKSQQLAQKLPRTEELTVVFNLKEMAAKR